MFYFEKERIANKSLQDLLITEKSTESLEKVLNSFSKINSDYKFACSKNSISVILELNKDNFYSFLDSCIMKLSEINSKELELNVPIYDTSTHLMYPVFLKVHIVDQSVFDKGFYNSTIDSTTIKISGPIKTELYLSGHLDLYTTETNTNKYNFRIINGFSDFSFFVQSLHEELSKCKNFKGEEYGEI